MPVIPYGATEGGWVRMTDIHKGEGIERGASVNDNDPGGREPPSVGQVLMTCIHNPDGRGQSSVGWVTMMGIPKGGSPMCGQGVNDIDLEGREPSSVGWELMTA